MSEEPLAVSSCPKEQLEAIRAMLSAGHCAIRVERHSLVLWGVTGAALILGTPKIITRARFPVVWQQASAELALLATVLALVTAVDFWVTRRVRQRQDESLPFIQRQIGKVWLLLVGLGLMATFGMHFYGGGAMVYVLWMLLLGIGLFTHGLFSQQFLGWSGAIVILLGASALALRVPTEGTKWLAVLVSGVGLPALGCLLGPLEKLTLPMRLGCVLAWAAAIAGAAYAVHRTGRIVDRPVAASISIGDFRRLERSAGEQVVSLPRGTVIPIRISLRGDTFVQSGVATVPLALTKHLDLVLIDGKLDGRFRVEGGGWKHYMYDFSAPSQRLVADFTREEGFAIEYTAQLATGR